MHRAGTEKPACPSRTTLVAAVFIAAAACSGTSVIGENVAAPGSAGAGGAAAGAGGSAAPGTAGTGGAAAGTGGSSNVAGSAGSDAAGTGGAAGSLVGGAGGGLVGGAGGGLVGGAGGGPALVRSDFPSCSGFKGDECQGGNCCDSILLPGGTLTFDGQPRTVPGFRLDKYEVTVARFRNFLNAVDAWVAAGNPKPGAGAHPSSPDSGWRPDWVQSVAQSPLKEIVANGLRPTWRNYPISWGSSPDKVVQDGNPDYVIPGTDGLAVNRVPFHIAFAFCIWDGGRLPAKLEHVAAVRGGDGQAAYPWGDTPAPTAVFAVRPQPSVPTTYNDTFWQYIAIPAGSHPASAGRFGHHDLAAGLDEYVRDAANAAGAPSSGGFIELGGDEIVAGDPKNPSSSFPVICRTAAPGDWLAPGRGDIFSRIDGIGDGLVGFRCARDQ